MSNMKQHIFRLLSMTVIWFKFLKAHIILSIPLHIVLFYTDVFAIYLFILCFIHLMLPKCFLKQHVLAGLDIAYISNGYVYHTQNDRNRYIQPGCVQRGGRTEMRDIH